MTGSMVVGRDQRLGSGGETRTPDLTIMSRTL